MSETSVIPSVVCVVGSPRAAGNTSFLVDSAIAELQRRGARCEKLMLADYRILPCEGHDDCADLPLCPLEDDAALLLEKVYGADILLLASPVYYEDVSAQMKAFIDRNCFNYNKNLRLAAKVVGLIAVAQSTGLDETLACLRRYVALSTDRALPTLTAAGFAHKVGDAGRDDGLARAVERLAGELLETWAAEHARLADSAPVAARAHAGETACADEAAPAGER